METVGRRQKRRRWGLFHADPIVLGFLGESTHGHFVFLGYWASFQFQGIDLEVGCWVTWLIKDRRVLDILRNSIPHSSHRCGCEGLWVGCESMNFTLSSMC